MVSVVKNTIAHLLVQTMQVSWQDFEAVEIRVGTIIEAQEFPEARKPAYKLKVDFGEFGIKKSSAQITTLYALSDLVGKQVIAVTNFPPKQIGSFVSECLVTGFMQHDGSVVLAVPDKPANNGLRLV